MSATRPGYSFSVFVAAIVAVFAFSAINPAYAAERKSIRWATSSTGSYGYKVAAQMIQVLEDALGGEYTVTVNPYPSTDRRHEGDDGWRGGDRLHGRRRDDPGL